MKRSAIGISPVGTSIRARENALAPEPFAARADGHAGPQLLDRRAHPLVVAAGGLGRGGEERGVERAAEPLGRGRVSPNGARSTSIRRLSERSVHSGDLACSVSLSWLITPRTVSAAAEPALGDARRVAEQIPDLAKQAERHPQAARQQVAQHIAVRIGRRRLAVRRARAASSGGGSGASRSKSRNCSDSFTLPSPSVIVWCSFSISADLPPRRPSTTTNCHSGRVRSNGSQAIRLARSSSWRIVPGFGQGDVAHVVSQVEVACRRPTSAP